LNVRLVLSLSFSLIPNQPNRPIAHPSSSSSFSSFFHFSSSSYTKPTQSTDRSPLFLFLFFLFFLSLLSLLFFSLSIHRKASVNVMVGNPAHAVLRRAKAICAPSARGERRARMVKSPLPSVQRQVWKRRLPTRLSHFLCSPHRTQRKELLKRWRLCSHL